MIAVLARTRTEPGRVAGLPALGGQSRKPYALIWTAVLAVAAVGGTIAATDVQTLLNAIAILTVAALCLIGPKTRLAIVVIGALVVFQSTLTTLKYGYLAVALLCLVLSLRGLLAADYTIRREFRPLCMASIALMAYLLFSYFVSRSHGTSFTYWFKDVLSYLLIAILPFVGIAAGRSITAAWYRWWFIVLGVVTSIGFLVDWLGRRDVSSLPVERFVLSSTVVVGLCFSQAFTMACLPKVRFRWAWATAVVIMFGAMILSGSRTNLVLLAAAIGVLGLRRHARVTAPRALALLVAIGVGFAVAGPPVAKMLVTEPTFFQDRIDAALTILNGHATQDASYAERVDSYQKVTAAFAQYRLLGTGPGYLYPTGGQGELPFSAFSLDAPGVVPAKFGVVGLIFLAWFLVAAALSIVRISRISGSSLPAVTGGRGWLVFLAALTPFGPWLEDKGFGLAIAMLFAAVLSDAARSTAGTQRSAATLEGPDAAQPREAPPVLLAGTST